MKGRRASGMHLMIMDNVLGDPLALATISISVVCQTLHPAATFPSLLTCRPYLACMVDHVRWIGNVGRSTRYRPLS
jgi:hypothetical protein